MAVWPKIPVYSFGALDSDMHFQMEPTIDPMRARLPFGTRSDDGRAKWAGLRTAGSALPVQWRCTMLHPLGRGSPVLFGDEPQVSLL